MKSGLCFPYEVFTIQNQDKYLEYSNKGLALSKTKRVLFCGICRNVADIIERNILRCLVTASPFLDYELFIYENDSNDGTQEILKSLSSDKIKVVCDTRQDKDYPELLKSGEDKNQHNRCKVLSSCRNVYLDYIKENSDRFDYVVILDLDIIGGWSYNGFYHSLSVFESNDVSCISAYGILSDPTNTYSLEQVFRPIMYDSFAFRPLGIEKSTSGSEFSSYNFIKLDVGQNPILVNSNFGGMAIYRIKDILDVEYGTYYWKDENENVDCDHVVLHRSLRGLGKKICINPSLTVSYSHHKYSKIKL
jgi:Cryptococcal mannosyltransferase 1